MLAMQQCVRLFPRVFGTPPWEDVPTTALQQLHANPLYRQADNGLKSAFDMSLSTDDQANAAVAAVERAKLHTRARDWQAAAESTQKAMEFCKEPHSRDESDRHLGEMYADSLCWRGAFLTFGRNEEGEGRRLLEAAKELYTRIRCRDGITAVEHMLPHVS